MIISDMYQTKIEASSYNVNIDSTGNVITVTLLDFNNQPVTNKSVTLTCDKGYFTKKGSTNISGTTTKSVTVNTDSNGKITATWTASEWGLCTFSANTTKTQIQITGWKTIYNDTNYTISTDGKMGHVLYHIPNFSLNSWNNFQNTTTFTTNTLKQYMPSGTQYSATSLWATAYLFPDGIIKIENQSDWNITNVVLNASFTFPLKTPKY